MSQGKSLVKVWICYVLLCVVWGSSFILIKKGVTAFSPLQLAVLRMATVMPIAGLLVTQSIKKIPCNKLGIVGLVGLISTFIPSVLFGIAQKEVNSSLAGILNATTPMFTCLVGFASFNDRLSKKQVMGLFLGFISVAALIMIKSRASLNTNVFGLFILLATLGYGININLVRFQLKDLDPLDITIAALFFAGSAASVLLLADLPTYIRLSRDHPGPFMAIMILGIAGTALAQYLQNILVKSTSPIFASSTTYVIPVVAIGWGLWDGEQIHWMIWMATTSIFLAIFMMRK